MSSRARASPTPWSRTDATKTSRRERGKCDPTALKHDHRLIITCGDACPEARHTAEARYTLSDSHVRAGRRVCARVLSAECARAVS